MCLTCLMYHTDRTADDEGLQYILPDSVLLGLALAAPTSSQSCKDVLVLHAGGPPQVAGISAAAFKQAAKLVHLMTAATESPTPYPYHLPSSVAGQNPSAAANGTVVTAAASAAVNSNGTTAAVAHVAASTQDAGGVHPTPSAHSSFASLRLGSHLHVNSAQPQAASSTQGRSVDALLASAGAPGGPVPASTPPARKHGGLASLPPEKQAAIIKKFASKGAVYENCVMLSQDGELLCHCDRRKLEWWVHRGI